jgi:uncharacterized protein YecE (DUF72 family)
MSPRRARIGTAGWTLPRELRARFPERGSMLERYAAVFDAVEINSTFYRLPRLGTLQRWRDVTPPHFRFAVKMPASITHELALRRARAPLREFVTRVRGLGTKLGPVLVQLPASHVFDARVCRRFLSCLRQEFSGTVVWEPRHASWFAPAAGALLAHFDVSRVAADPACVPAAGLPLGKVTYYRLHGSPRIYYSSYDRKTVIALARALGASPTKETAPWCIFDNTALGAATLNALELHAEIASIQRSPARRA